MPLAPLPEDQTLVGMKASSHLPASQDLRRHPRRLDEQLSKCSEVFELVGAILVLWRNREEDSNSFRRAQTPVHFSLRSYQWQSTNINLSKERSPLLRAIAATANPTRVSPQATATATQMERYATCFCSVLARICCTSELTELVETFGSSWPTRTSTIRYLLSCFRGRSNNTNVPHLLSV
jgi:hypothetical protein